MTARIVIMVAALGAATFGAPGIVDSGEPDPRASERTVPLPTLASALASRPLADGILADELAFFSERAAERTDDRLSMMRLVRVRQLRFRAYNDPVELDEAEAVLQRLARTYPEDAGVAGARTAIALARHDFTSAVRFGRSRVSFSAAGDDGATLGLFDGLWAGGAYGEARVLLEGASGDTTSIGFRARRARVVDGLGDVGAAADQMERVVELTDAYAESSVVRAWARVEHGHFLLHSGHPNEAVERYAEALELVPGYPAALEGLGWIAYGVDGDLAAAEALFSRSAAFGRHVDLYALLEEVARARGDDVRAVEYRERFFAEAQASPEAVRLNRRPLAMALAEAGRLSEALGYAEEDLAARHDRGAWITRGWVLHRMGRTEEALADVDRAIAWGAPEPGTLHLAGLILVEAGEVRRGRALLREALEGRAELGPVVAGEVEEVLGR